MDGSGNTILDPVSSNNSSTDTDTLTPEADLAMTKTDNGVVVPGQAIVYTVTVTNNGPSAVTAAPIADTLPAAITSDSWTAVSSAGSSVAAGSGTGAISTTGNLLPAGTITFTVTANISQSATGQLINTATVTAPVGVTDTNPTNNSATDTVTSDAARGPGHHQERQRCHRPRATHCLHDCGDQQQPHAVTAAPIAAQRCGDAGCTTLWKGTAGCGGRTPRQGNAGGLSHGKACGETDARRER